MIKAISGIIKYYINQIDEFIFTIYKMFSAKGEEKNMTLEEFMKKRSKEKLEKIKTEFDSYLENNFKSYTTSSTSSSSDWIGPTGAQGYTGQVGVTGSSGYTRREMTARERQMFDYQMKMFNDNMESNMKMLDEQMKIFKDPDIFNM